MPYVYFAEDEDVTFNDISSLSKHVDKVSGMVIAII